MAITQDTIEVLDNLQFNQEATAEIWLIDGEGSAFDSVKSYAVAIPASVGASRVIFNNWYDTAAAQVTVRVKSTMVTALNPLTKTETDVLEWTAVEPATLIGDVGMLVTSAVDLSAAFESTLHIDCALTSAVAHTGTEIIIQVRSKTATPNQWSVLTSFVGPTGTPAHVHPSAQANAAQNVIAVADPVTANLNHIGKWLFIKNAVIANSEMVYIIGCGIN